jgi:hypothetical protein
MLHGVYRNGWLYAIAGRHGAFMAPRFARRPDADPEKRILSWACQYFRDLEAGVIAGRPRSVEAWRYARFALIPDDWLEHTDDDGVIAVELMVPVREVAAARAERAAGALPPAAVVRVEQAYRPAPWLARVLLLLGLWLTVMYGIELIVESNGHKPDADAPNATLVFFIGVAALIGAWGRMRLHTAMQRRRQRRAAHVAHPGR